MPTCRRRCSRMRWSVPPKPWRSTTSRRTSLPISRRNLTRNITLHGTALWAETLAATSHTRPSISFISTWAKLQFCCLNQVKCLK
ncbi:unnamed protein product [Staurois parvus]|uniref:Uncharacterized protein n=1 Tax=Staurois parvus TaxID=386267 RepID=A0ABN9C1P4_9NEOB|nr:unnamed protein product [Staurois parvus]